jgi:uncharacterized membrane protein YgcG
MRTARLLSAILTILSMGLSGGLLAPPAGAQPPGRLTDYITDDTNVLSVSGRATVKSALDRLYDERHIRLWVAYVDDFSGLSAEDWARRTTRASDFGNYDALLAISATGRAYAFLVSDGIRGVSQGQVDDLRRNQIEPALRAKDWSGAAVAAANGLDTTPSSSSRVVLLIALVVIAIALVALLLFMRRRARRRRAAALAAAHRRWRPILKHPGKQSPPGTEYPGVIVYVNGYGARTG